MTGITYMLLEMMLRLLHAACVWDNRGIEEFLPFMENPDYGVDQWVKEKTLVEALTAAAYTGNSEAFKNILKYQKTPLTSRALIEMLVLRDPSMLRQTLHLIPEELLPKCLVRAARSGAIDHIQVVLEKYPGAYTEEALIMAKIHCHHMVVEALLKHAGSNSTHELELNETTLVDMEGEMLLAVISGKISELEDLLRLREDERYIDIVSPFVKKRTQEEALVLAALIGNTIAYETILKYHKSPVFSLALIGNLMVNSPSLLQQTLHIIPEEWVSLCLLTAASSDSFRHVEALLGAYPDMDTQQALAEAEGNGYRRTIEVLVLVPALIRGVRANSIRESESGRKQLTPAKPEESDSDSGSDWSYGDPPNCADFLFEPEYYD